jgi:two-component system response regulator
MPQRKIPMKQPLPQPILLVEDSEDDFEATSRAFKKVNLRNPVVWCQSGPAALDYLRHEGAHKDAGGEPPGLILLDLNMPGMDGRQTLKIIKQDVALKRIPVIILTTSGDERDVKTCYQLGANTYVQKPVSFDGLIEAIQRLKAYWFEFALLPKDAEVPLGTET